MGDEHDGDPAVAHALDQVPGVPPGLRVKASGELVEDRDPRAADQRHGDGQPLLLAAGELAERGPGLGRDPEHLHQLPPVRRALVKGAGQFQRLADPELVGQPALLQLHPELLGQLGPVPLRVQPEDADLAPVRLPQSLDAFHGRGLARAVRAEDPEDLALVHAEGHVADRHGVPVLLVQVLHFYDW